MIDNDDLLKLYLPRARKVNKNALYGAAINWKNEFDEHRFFLIDNFREIVIYSWYTSHGSGSGDSLPLKFSNVPNSHMSSRGNMITGETYYGKHDYSLKLHGLEVGINDNVEKRSIVMHSADYVKEEYVKRKGRAGTSLGCITLNPADHEFIINALKGGSPIINLT